MMLQEAIRRPALLLCALLVCAGVPAMAAAAPRADCDEACLKSVMDGYLHALEAHDPGRLKVAPNVRFTENGVVIPLASLQLSGPARCWFVPQSQSGQEKTAGAINTPQIPPQKAPVPPHALMRSPAVRTRSGARCCDSPCRSAITS